MEKDTGFLSRHVGINKSDIKLMLKSLGLESLDQLIEKIIPPNIFSPIRENLIDITFDDNVTIIMFSVTFSVINFFEIDFTIF